jgi:hypothetical protein
MVMFSSEVRLQHLLGRTAGGNKNFGCGRQRPWGGGEFEFVVSRIQNKRLTNDYDVNGRDLFH